MPEIEFALQAAAIHRLLLFYTTFILTIGLVLLVLTVIVGNE